MVASVELAPSRSALDRIFDLKYAAGPRLGWSPAMRRRFGYFTPDDQYEALLDALVEPGTAWLDVGCGRTLFPDNKRLSGELAARCETLVGVDPDTNLHENPYVHERVFSSIEDYEPHRTFDLVTMRMVAEHVARPAAAAGVLTQCLSPGGQVVIYTVYGFSPVPILTRFIPTAIRHPIKKLLWRTEKEDTFPTFFRMNTRRRLHGLMDQAGFDEAWFELVEDCRTLGRFRLGQWTELSLRRVLNGLGLRYPERCILAVYRRRDD